MRLIALCSPAMGSGKSTAAEYLVEHHGFIRVAFATPLKRTAEALLQATGMPANEIVDRVYGDRKEELLPVFDITSRKLQQLLGTEFGRDLIRPSIWVDLAMANVARFRSLGHPVVIDDMRFPNEYDAVQAAGGDCYRIVRPEATVTRAHASEGQLDGVHMQEIWNTASVEDLLRAVDARIFAA
jgi:hypothetical protein